MLLDYKRSMIDALITSKTRVKLLLRFFLNSNNTTYLRELASDFNESTNSIRLELNRFEEAGLLKSEMDANKKMYCADTQHPLFDDIHNILLKYIGFDRIIDEVISKIGQLKKVMVLGDFAKGMDSKVIDLLFVGEQIDNQYLLRLLNKAEKIIKRKIRFLIMNEKEAELFVQDENKNQNVLLLWQAE